MKLCNDCDLNYRQSKNKRLLVELTLIQVAQLTAEPEDAGSGMALRNSYPRLPYGTSQSACSPNRTSDSCSYSSGLSADSSASTGGSKCTTLYKHLAATGSTLHKSSPLPKVSTERKAPVIKAGSLGMSIRKHRQPPQSQLHEQHPMRPCNSPWQRHGKITCSMKRLRLLLA